MSREVSVITKVFSEKNSLSGSTEEKECFFRMDLHKIGELQ